MNKIIFLAIISLFILSSCAKLEDAGYEVGKKIGSGLIGEELEEDQTDYFCIHRAEDLLTSDVNLISISDEWYLKEYVFSDGTLDPSVSIRYRLGEKQGENLAYRYPDNILERSYVKYSKQEIGSDGTIKGDFEFKVKLILNESSSPSTLLVDTVYGKEVESQPYVVVSKEFISCHLP